LSQPGAAPRGTAYTAPIQLRRGLPALSQASCAKGTAYSVPRRPHNISVLSSRLRRRGQSGLSPFAKAQSRSQGRAARRGLPILPQAGLNVREQSPALRRVNRKNGDTPGLSCSAERYPSARGVPIFSAKGTAYSAPSRQLDHSKPSLRLPCVDRAHAVGTGFSVPSHAQRLIEARRLWRVDRAACPLRDLGSVRLSRRDRRRSRT